MERPNPIAPLLIALALPAALWAQPAIVGSISFGSSRAGALTANPVTNTVYAAQEDFRQIAVIDGKTQGITASVSTQGYHIGLDANPFTNKIYLAQQFAGNVRVIDGSTNGYVNLPVPGLIHTVGELAVNPATNRLYVIRANNNDIAVFDAATHAFLGAIAPGGGGPAGSLMGLAVNPATNRIYVSNRGNGSVTVIDGASNAVLAQVPIGADPRLLAVDPDRNLTYVPVISSNYVAVIDGSTNSVIANIVVGAGPISVGINPINRRVYVAGNGSRDLAVIDGDTRAVVATVPLGVSAGAGELAVLPALNRVFVTAGHYVQVIEDAVPASSCLAPATGLDAWWPGDGSFHDLAGGNHATAVHGTTFASAKVGQGFQFDGVDDYLTVPDQSGIRADAELSILFWANFGKVPRGSGDPMVIMEKGGNAGPSADDYIVSWRPDLEALAIDIADCGGRYYLGSYARLPALKAGDWHHYAITAKDGGAAGPLIRIFVDGIEYPVQPHSNLICGWGAGASGPLQIGARIYEGSLVAPFQGILDETQFYGRLLAPAEIRAMVHAGNLGVCKPTPNSAPVADAGENVNTTSANAPALVLHGFGSDADGNALNCRWSENTVVLKDWTPAEAAGQCPLALAGLGLGLGEHALTLEVSDGLSTSADGMLLTIDNSSPTVVVSGSGSYEIGASIPLGGTVSDFDGDILHYEWTLGGNSLCAGTLAASAGGSPVSLPSCPAGGLALGSHAASLQVSDGNNGPVTDTAEIDIVDHSKPTLSPVASQGILWPPNHAMIEVTVQSHAADNSGHVDLSASVSSSEPQDGLGDGDIGPDWTAPEIDQATGSIRLQLRAERSGKGTGRVYSIKVSAADAAGNSSETTVEIKVPHSQGKK